MRDGKTWDNPEAVDEPYDLVVVGGGISGLSAAYFFRKLHGERARILVLDNHDDFGGHAKRNEFWHDGKMYLMNGGTLNVEAPAQYSTVAAGLLWELGIDRTRYYDSVAKVSDLYKKLGLGYGVFFDRETFGSDRLVPGYGKLPIREFLAGAPLSERVKSDLARIYDGKEDYLPGLSSDAKKKKLAHVSYRDYLIEMAKADPGVVPFLNSRPMGLFCTGIDAVPALYAWEMEFPGFSGLGLEPTPPERLLGEPGGAHGRENAARADGGDPDMYFPDGNATIARLLVRALLPKAVPGGSMEDVVGSRVDYGCLDEPGSALRIRLESTVVNVGHDGPVDRAREVSLTYVRKGRAYRVRAGAAVLACWNNVIPYIWSEIPADQKKALLDGVKAPLVYTSVLVSSWKSFVKAGISGVSAPGSYHVSLGLGSSLSLGDYRSSQDPETPIVLRMSRYPCSPWPLASRAAPRGPTGAPLDRLRDLRAEDSRSARKDPRPLRLRPARGRSRDHREPLAPRLRLRLQHALRSGGMGVRRSRRRGPRCGGGALWDGWPSRIQTRRRARTPTPRSTKPIAR